MKLNFQDIKFLGNRGQSKNPDVFNTLHTLRTQYTQT